MLNERFDELSRKNEAQFLGAGAYESPLSPSVVGVRAGAGVEEGKIPPGLSALEIETNRVQQYGFGAGGARAREEVVARLLRARLQRARQERERRLRPGIRQPLPPGGAGARHRVRVPAGAGADPGDHRGRSRAAMAKALFADTARVVIATSPQKEGLALPTEAQLRDAITKADAVAVTAWNDAGSGRALMDDAAGARRDQGPARDPGARRHGRPLRQRRRGLAEADRLQERRGPLQPGRAGRRLAGAAREVRRGAARAGAGPALGYRRPPAPWICRSCSPASSPRAAPAISLSTHAISGSARPGDLETGLQLLYLSFTAPGQRRRGVREHPQAARRDVREPRAESWPALRREGRAGQLRQPLHRRAGHARAARRSSIATRWPPSTRSGSRTPPISRS